MATGSCPECEGDIRFIGPPRKGHAVTCPTCGAYLKVVSESPIELDWSNGDLEGYLDASDDDEDEDEDDGSDFD